MFVKHTISRNTTCYGQVQTTQVQKSVHNKTQTLIVNVNCYYIRKRNSGQTAQCQEVICYISIINIILLGGV
jgi:hypothetical protein